MDQFKLMCETHHMFMRGCEAELPLSMYECSHDPLQESEHGWFNTTTLIHSINGRQPSTMIRLTRLMHDWVSDLPLEFKDNTNVSFAITDQSTSNQCMITVTFAYRRRK